jgi:hypothetical protein
MAIYDDFCQSTQAVLFATDIAARGLGTSFRLKIFCYFLQLFEFESDPAKIETLV